MTHVTVRTDLGSFIVTLADDQAPRTCAAFRRHVELGHYDGGSFHRVVTPATSGNDLLPPAAVGRGLRGDRSVVPPREVPIAILQGGAVEGVDGQPIPFEPTDVTGLRHVDGAISMARQSPDSAVSEFFLSIGDQPELDSGGGRHADGRGFAVFGRVTSGMEVVRDIHGQPSVGQTLTPPIPILGAHIL